VEALRPKVSDVYKGLGVTNVVGNPTTLEELFGPYLDTLNQIVGPSKEDEKKTP
jgi:hypothetical protein